MQLLSGKRINLFTCFVGNGCSRRHNITAVLDAPLSSQPWMLFAKSVKFFEIKSTVAVMVVHIENCLGKPFRQIRALSRIGLDQALQLTLFQKPVTVAIVLKLNEKSLIFKNDSFMFNNVSLTLSKMRRTLARSVRSSLE